MYRTNLTFAPHLPVQSPLYQVFNSEGTSSFSHGYDAVDISKSSKTYRNYISDQCSQQWSDVCQVVFNEKAQPFSYYKGDYEAIEYNNLTSGDLILRSTAEKKYIHMVDSKCEIEITKFNNQVPGSPYTSNFSNNCKKIYYVDPSNVDHDPVMNNLLQKPIVAMDVLKSIYETAKSKNTLNKFKGTKLGAFFETTNFQMALCSK
jgi:hypothetical protein